MEWHVIVASTFKSIFYTFLVFFVTWCFFTAYQRCLRYCFQSPRQEAANDGYSAGSSIPTVGLQQSEIDEFPKFGYPMEMSREITECVVCLAAFREGETLRLIPMCSHVFHADCVDVWLRSHATCPCCRAYLKIPSTAETSQTTTELPV